MRSQELAGVVQEALLARGATVACAESLTGGALSDLLSGAPGASATFRGGLVAYATEVKTSVLGVRAETVRAHGVVSEQCAAEMADRIRSLLGASMGVSTTGVAGPDRQEGKAVGTVFVAVSTTDGVATYPLQLDGGRAAIRAATCQAALAQLLAVLG